MRMLEEEIARFCSENERVILAGDYNARTSMMRDYISPDKLTMPDVDIFDFESDTDESLKILESLNIQLHRESKDAKSNTLGITLLDICRHNNLFMLNGRYGNDKNVGQLTFRDKSVIDYVLSTAYCFNFIEDFSIVATDKLFSDGHALLQWSLKCHSPSITVSNPEIEQYSIKLRWDEKHSENFVKNINENEFLSVMEEINEIRPSPENIESITKKLTDILNKSAHATLKTPNIIKKNMNGKGQPWFGTKCEKARKVYHKAKLNYNKHRNIQNKQRLNMASSNYKKTMNFYINKYNFENEKKLRNMETKNPKKYWKILKKSKKKKSDVSNQPDINEFYNYFKNINMNNEKEDTFENSDSDFTYLDNTELNSPITGSEILKCISNLKNSKAPSTSDNILNEYIKSTKDKLLPIYIFLFNSILDTGYMPESWLIGAIKPIYKGKGSPCDPGNYRPITILSCLGKLFTAVLNTRITKFLEENDIINENQAGFRKRFSCFDHIFTLNTLINILKNKKQKLFCCFVDFSQAFDKVWRIGLWSKLLQSGINGKVFKVIHNMYQNIKSFVDTNDQNSPLFSCENGVRQGENLSPILFSLFLNDLESHLLIQGGQGITLNSDINELYWLKLLVLLYADDTILLAESASDLQNMLNSFEEYCNQWKLKVNLSKTNIIIFGSRNTTHYNFTFGNEKIETTKEYKYLGLIFTSNGSFLTARKHLVSQAKKAMHTVLVQSRSLRLPIDLQLKLFDYTVVPILLYAAEIWGYESHEPLEKIHIEFLRRITKSKKSTPRYMLYGELGRYPLTINIKTRMINFWNRIICSHDNKISKLIYSYMLYDTNNLYKWLDYIKSVFSNTGNGIIWQTQNHNKVKGINQLIKHTLVDQFQQEWSTSLMQSHKGRNYSIFKTELKFETYLTELPIHLAINLFRFRTSNHKLPVETGRWQGIPQSERKCTKCNANRIGDEMHYLLGCTYFSTSRKKFLKTPIRNNTFDFKRILTAKDNETLINTSKFVSQIIKEVC